MIFARNETLLKSYVLPELEDHTFGQDADKIVNDALEKGELISYANSTGLVFLKKPKRR